MPVTPDLAALKSRLRLGRDAHDDELEGLLAGALSFAQGTRGTGRQLTALDDPDGNPTVVRVRASDTTILRIPDAREVLSVTTSDHAPLTGWEIGTGHPNVTDPAPFLHLASATSGTLLLTGRFGFHPTPDDIADAVLTLAARRFYELRTGVGDAIAAAGGGGDDVIYSRALPATARAIFDSYRIASDRMGAW